MSKRDKKRKKKRVPSSDEYGGGGFLTSMRGGFKNLAGVSSDRGAGKPAAGRAKDILFWLVIATLLVVLFYRLGVRR